MSELAAALNDTLLRLLPPPQGSGTLGAQQQLIAALTAALERGELGLNLEGPAPEGVEPEDWPARHLKALESSGWLVEAEALRQEENLGKAEPCEAVLVRDGRWLRWRRWHTQLEHCLNALISRANSPVEPASSAAQLREAERQALAAELDPQQREAVLALLQQRLVLLLGGPGTGKTSTVAAMLAAALSQQPNLRLQLAAPTGKAAARLAAAMAAAGQSPVQALPCSTLHRLLEATGDSHFRRNRRLPLELDLLVVDELSMVDLPLMAALLEALPAEARLLLVGDAGQLPPVGTGAVLEELCRPEQRRQLGPAAVELRTTYRNNGAIAAIANRLREERSAAGPALLQTLRNNLRHLTAADNLRWQEASLSQPPPLVLQRLQQHQQRLRELAQHIRWIVDQPDPQDSAQLLEELEALIALSPIRQGPWGVEALHRALLGAAASAPVQHWPVGTPVLNRLNRPEQGLANGDIGVLVERQGERQVLLPGPRLLHPARLGAAEPALALTVHKAQGSQYGEVLLLIPPSRQSDHRLIYTGLTRARQQALLVTPSEPA